MRRRSFFSSLLRGAGALLLGEAGGGAAHTVRPPTDAPPPYYYDWNAKGDEPYTNDPRFGAPYVWPSGSRWWGSLPYGVGNRIWLDGREVSHWYIFFVETGARGRVFRRLHGPENTTLTEIFDRWERRWVLLGRPNAPRWQQWRLTGAGKEPEERFGEERPVTVMHGGVVRYEYDESLLAWDTGRLVAHYAGLRRPDDDCYDTHLPGRAWDATGEQIRGPRHPPPTSPRG